ncbi:hypothetical protein VTK26DRAFT_7717 [Humicola hyalothermophila]
MAFSLEAIYSFFSPPASRNSSPQGTPSLFSSALFPFSPSANKSSISSATAQTDLPMPPSSAAAFNTSAMPASPAESSNSLSPPSERDFSPLASPYPTPATMNTATNNMPATHRSDSMSSASTSLTSTTTASSSSLANQNHHNHPGAPAPRRAQTEIGPLDPLSRTYGPVGEEPSLDELLARKPGKWSLGHYVKHAKVRHDAQGSEVDRERRARELEQAKRELLRAKEEMDGLRR